MKKNYEWEIGDKIFIRTVTYHYVGKLVDKSDDSLWLANTSWVADSGRFNNALKNGELHEVEPYPGDGIIEIMRTGIIDICTWDHPLPTEVL